MKYTEQWRTESVDAAKEFTFRSDVVVSFDQTSVHKTQLQRWRIYQIWGELPKFLGGLAILLVGQTKLALSTDLNNFQYIGAVGTKIRRIGVFVRKISRCWGGAIPGECDVSGYRRSISVRHSCRSRSELTEVTEGSAGRPLEMNAARDAQSFDELSVLRNGIRAFTKRLAFLTVID